MKKVITEDERRKPIVDRMIDEYVQERFEGFYPGGRKVMITPVDVEELTRRVVAEDKTEEKGVIMSKDFYGKWSKAIKGISLGTGGFMWELAIEFLMSDGAIAGAVPKKLSQSCIQGIILKKRPHLTIHTLFADLANWMDDPAIEEYLDNHFYEGDEIWLAYLMAVHYGLFWDGA